MTGTRIAAAVTAGLMLLPFFLGMPPQARAGAGPLSGAAGNAATSPGREAIETILREYLKKHPEVIIEALNAYRQKLRQAQKEHARATVVSERKALVHDPDSPVAGNPNGDVTVVEFFDYRCPYCKRVAQPLFDAVKSDGDVRLVFKDWPILKGPSVYAAKAALASRAQGKYVPFHQALMLSKVQLTEHVVMSIARSVGIDTERLARDMQSSDIERILAKNFALASKLGIDGTPAFIVGDELVPGAIDTKTLKSLIAQAREKG